MIPAVGSSGSRRAGPGQPVDAGSDLTRRIRAVLEAIPAGSVATYGQVAALAGNPRAARAVVWVLRRGEARREAGPGRETGARGADDEAGAPVPRPRRPLPWHRVINSRGTISLPRGDGFELQRALLLDEGVSVTADGRVDLGRYLWDGQGVAG